MNTDSFKLIAELVAACAKVINSRSAATPFYPEEDKLVEVVTSPEGFQNVSGLVALMSCPWSPYARDKADRKYLVLNNFITDDDIPGNKCLVMTVASTNRDIDEGARVSLYNFVRYNLEGIVDDDMLAKLLVATHTLQRHVTESIGLTVPSALAGREFMPIGDAIATVNKFISVVKRKRIKK